MAKRDFSKDGKLKIFLSYYKPHIRLFLMDIFSMLIICAIDLAYPQLSRKALNELLPQNAFKAFFIAMAILIGAMILRTGLSFIVIYVGHIFGVKIENDIRKDLFEHIQTLGFDFFDKNRTGSLMSRMTSDLFEVAELSHHAPEDIINSSVNLIGSLILIFIIQWRLALVLIIVIPLLILLVLSRRKKLRDTSAAVKVKTAIINSDLESSLSGFRTAKAFGREEEEIRKFDISNENLGISKNKRYLEMSLFQSSMNFVTHILPVIVIATGGYLIMKGQMTVVDLVTFSLYITSFTNPITRLVALSETLSAGGAGLDRFIELMKTEPTIKDRENAVELQNIKGNIELDHVSFEYTSDLPVLKDISLKVRKNETIAIVGPSGGGKTTLISLIPRFYEIQSGAIRIDGYDIQDVTQLSLHRSIGIVQQDVFLFADTIRNNIAYGKPGATEKEIIEAAKKAEIYDDIMSMPDGLDTYVGERGAKLSGGQKQRIAIARIFLKNPPILILDEATSALDTVTESKIQAAFDALAKGRTTLIIAHRLSTIRNASRIIVIDEGTLKEQGTHKELMQLDGLYAQLYNTQTKLHN